MITIKLNIKWQHGINPHDDMKAAVGEFYGRLASKQIKEMSGKLDAFETGKELGSYTIEFS